MTIISVKKDTREEILWVFVETAEAIPYDTYVELNGNKANSYVYKPEDGWNPPPDAPAQGCLGFSFADTSWVMGNDFTIVSDNVSQVVSNYQWS